VEQLADIEERMNADQSVEILENNLLSGMEKSEIPPENLVVQQDNNSKDTSNKARRCLKNHYITLID